jgi:hypothetical protein
MHPFLAGGAAPWRPGEVPPQIAEGICTRYHCIIGENVFQYCIRLKISRKNVMVSPAGCDSIPEKEKLTFPGKPVHIQSPASRFCWIKTCPLGSFFRMVKSGGTPQKNAQTRLGIIQAGLLLMKKVT